MGYEIYLVVALIELILMLVVLVDLSNKMFKSWISYFLWTITFIGGTLVIELMIIGYLMLTGGRL